MFWHRWETCDILSLHVQDLVEMNSIETCDEWAHPLYYQPVRVWVDHNLLDVRCVPFISLLIIIIPLSIIVIHPIVPVVAIPIIAVALVPVVGAMMIRSTSLSAAELVVVIDIVIIIIASSSPPEVCEASLCTSEFIPSVPISVGRVIEVGFQLPLVREIQT